MTGSIAENLSFNLDFKLQENLKNVLLTFMLAKAKGEVYQNEIYLVLTGNERLQGEINYHSLNNSIDFSNLKLILPEILNFQSSGKLVLSDFSANNGVDLTRFNASLDIKDFTQLSQLYLNNILEGSDYEGLKIEGPFKGHIQKNRQFIKFSTEFHDLSLAFNEYGEHEQFSFIDLNGKMYWNNYNQEHNIFDIYPEHFSFFASFAPFAVYDSGHRKERKVRKDSLNCLVLDYKL